MKLNFIFIVLLTVLSTLGLQAQSDDNRFEKLADNKNIKTMIASKFLLSLAGELDLGTGMNKKDLFDKLDGVEIYTTQNKGATKKMQKEMSKVKKDKNYEKMIDVQEDGYGTSIYARAGLGETFRELILFKDGKSDCSIMRIIGSFSLDDMKQIANSKD